MALIQFIKELLYLNDKIVIPGFGGFVAQYTPAQINQEKNTITPPVKYFIFDNTLTEDDGVLANYISRKKSIPVSEATAETKEMVDDFRHKLNEGNTLFFEGIGYLLQDDQKIIRFKKDEERNYHPEYFGLGIMPLKAISKDEEPIEDTYYPVQKKRSIGKILLIFLILNVVGASSAFVYWKFDTIKAFFRKSPAKQAQIPSPDTARYQFNRDTSEVGQHIDTSTNIKNALRYEETPKQEPQIQQTSETEKTYYIIAGSFQTFEKADLHAKILAKTGLKTEVIEFGKDLFRISVGEYKGKEEAVKQLGLVKCKKGAENAWLLAK